MVIARVQRYWAGEAGDNRGLSRTTSDLGGPPGRVPRRVMAQREPGQISMAVPD